jgi:glycosyltransferase involved in cell wall biosynthesis
MVLHVRVVTETGGGPEKTILSSPRHLANLGYSARCAYLHPPEDGGFAKIRRQAQRCDAPLDEVADRGPLDLSVVPKLWRLCEKHDVRIWHGHDYKSNVLGVLLSRFRRMRLVTTVHGWGVQGSAKTPLYYAVDRRSLRFFDRVICVSPDLADRCRAAGVRGARCVLIENAIDSEVFRRITPCADAKRGFGVADGRLVIGAIGRLSAEKRFAELIHVFRRLILDGLDAELWIVGEGAERPRLESLIHDMGLTDRIRLLGYQSNVLGLLQAMDVLALNSVREGLPNALLEAMACEVPVVTTDVGGIARAITHRQNGMLVDWRDQPAFREALDSLLRDTGLRRAMARAARATIEQRYSFSVRMRRVAAVYDAVLGETSAARGFDRDAARDPRGPSDLKVRSRVETPAAAALPLQSVEDGPSD